MSSEFVPLISGCLLPSNKLQWQELQGPTWAQMHQQEGAFNDQRGIIIVNSRDDDDGSLDMAAIYDRGLADHNWTFMDDPYIASYISLPVERVIPRKTS